MRQRRAAELKADRGKAESVVERRPTEEAGEAAVQRRASAEAPVAADALATAARGVAGGGGALPHAAAIQKSFGSHDVSGIRAHLGAQAAEAAEAIGAEAYATGSDVAFQRTPDLHTAAHEAAHIIQQRAGVSLKGGIGAEGDAYERHADAVADAVVRGESAETLLDAMPGAGSGAQRGGAVQRKEKGEKTAKQPSGASSSGKAEVTGALDAVKDQLIFVFDDLDKGAAGALRALRTDYAKNPQSSSLMIDLLLAATSLTVVGYAGVVGAVVASRLEAAGESIAKGVGDQAKQLIKTCLDVGAKEEATANPQATLVDQFDHLTMTKLSAAKRQAISLFDRFLGKLLLHLSDRQLWTLEGALANRGDTIISIQEKATFVGWTNFIAQANYGTASTAPGKEATMSSANVDTAVARKQNILVNASEANVTSHPEPEGILEVGVWVEQQKLEDGTKGYYSRPFPLYGNASENALSLRGVHPAALASLKTMGKVKDVPINKIVRVFDISDGWEPPVGNYIPIMSVLVGADGKVLSVQRRKGHFTGEEAWEMAKDVPMTYLN